MMRAIGEIITKHLKIFHFFNEVFLFGSALDNNIYSNDIDLVLIYKEYSHQINTERKKITLYLEELLGIDIDLTILSEQELEQTKFLDKLYSPYKRLK